MGLRLRSDVSTTDTEYGAVLLDERNGEYWHLNTTGARVVRLLLAGSSPAEAAATVAEEFEIDESHVLPDVTALVDQLRSARLVTS